MTPTTADSFLLFFSSMNQVSKTPSLKTDRSSLNWKLICSLMCIPIPPPDLFLRFAVTKL